MEHWLPGQSAEEQTQTLQCQLPLTLQPSQLYKHVAFLSRKRGTMNEGIRLEDRSGHIPVFPTLWRQKQEDQKFKALAT